jgi:hypothetical protein
VLDAPSGFGQGLQDGQAASWDFPSTKSTDEAAANGSVSDAPLLRRLTQLALRELHGPDKDDTALEPCTGPAPKAN